MAGSIWSRRLVWRAGLDRVPAAAAPRNVAPLRRALNAAFFTKGERCQKIAASPALDRTRSELRNTVRPRRKAWSRASPGPLCCCGVCAGEPRLIARLAGMTVGSDQQERAVDGCLRCGIPARVP